MKKRRMKNFIPFCLILSLLFFQKKIMAQTATEASTITGKVICGYQGWFNCYGDGSPVARWFHWSNGQYQTDNGKPAAGQLKFEVYPDISEYNATSLFQTGFAAMGDGTTPSKLFSSYKEDVIEKHFGWMQQNGIDGIALQRFISETFDGVFKANRDSISARVKRQAEKYQRVFYLMYDVSGLDVTKFDSIKSDWQNNMVGKLHLTSSPYYIHQNNKPVVCLWGFGFTDRPGDTTQCLNVINWFKSNGCFVIGGVPTNWRTSTSDSKANFQSVYNAYDMISPWSVGRFSTNTGADNFKTTYLNPDLAYCKSKNILYQPVIFPGFAWSNWNGGTQNSIPRNKGEFMWRQLYNIKQDSINNMYVAMFDEYDEGTAITKAADSYYEIPTDQYFLTTSADGTYISSDFYLRLVGKATQVIKGSDTLTLNVPIPYSVGPMWFRSGFEMKYDAVPNWTDSPELTAGNINVIGYGGSVNPPECGVVSETNHIGINSLRYAGRDNSTNSSHYYYKIFDVNIPVKSLTKLSFWTYPQSSLARYVSVDLLMTDGTTLRNSGATDINGVSMNPSAGRGTVNTWTRTQSNIGLWLNGKTIQRILIGYDHDAESGDFRGYIDDIVIDESGTVVPVKLSQFNGVVLDRSVELSWTTEQDINTASTVIERSFNGSTFTEIASLQSDGNSSNTRNYIYNDNNIQVFSEVVYYRLKFISTDGQLTYSQTISLPLSSFLSDIKLFPNPAKNMVQLTIKIKEKTIATINIIDNDGKIVLSKQTTFTPGINSTVISGLSRLASGLYKMTVQYNGKTGISSLVIKR
jgi:hypothetical protein